jgi:hypothetical protein
LTPLGATTREPATDILAQWLAFRDPAHPKRAMWVAHGTPLPTALRAFGGIALELPEGWLFANPIARSRLAAEPSEEVLAEILDYEEPKSAGLFRGAAWLIVVQALDAADNVVQEMLTSWERLPQAKDRAGPYGSRLRLLTTQDCQARRARLVLEEDAAA